MPTPKTRSNSFAAFDQNGVQVGTQPCTDHTAADADGLCLLPYSCLESVIELNKEAYYPALRQTQGMVRSDAPHWQPWLVFFLRSLAEQVRWLEKKVEREKIVLATLPDLSQQVVEFARAHGRALLPPGTRTRMPTDYHYVDHSKSLIRGIGR